MTSFVLVDGYNIIYAWEELALLARDSLESARDKLIEIMQNYAAFTKETVILVFDAHLVFGGVGSVINLDALTVVYTKEKETADAYIERSSYILAKNSKVRVATSDGMEQIIILSVGAYRVSAREFYIEVMGVKKEISDIIDKSKPVKNNALFTNLDQKTQDFLDRILYADLGKKGKRGKRK